MVSHQPGIDTRNLADHRKSLSEQQCWVAVTFTTFANTSLYNLMETTRNKIFISVQRKDQDIHHEPSQTAVPVHKFILQQKQVKSMKYHVNRLLH